MCLRGVIFGMGLVRVIVKITKVLPTLDKVLGFWECLKILRVFSRRGSFVGRMAIVCIKRL